MGETENFSPTPPLTFFCILKTPHLRIFQTLPCIFHNTAAMSHRIRFEAEEKRPPRRRGVYEKEGAYERWLRLLGSGQLTPLPLIHSGNSLAIALRAICMRSQAPPHKPPALPQPHDVENSQ
uniref:Uncharacterized protein n=1 Tax=Magnetococcus massalia (strain MO-1) TaxID=451514 RepID=A0A1S7LJ92_MAGMO|nr:Protein of unknown function [Candidatus Magnetococcus massalia]